MPTECESICCKEIQRVSLKIDEEQLECITAHDGFHFNFLNHHVELGVDEYNFQAGPLDDNEEIHA